MPLNWPKVIASSQEKRNNNFGKPVFIRRSQSKKWHVNYHVQNIFKFLLDQEIICYFLKSVFFQKLNDLFINVDQIIRVYVKCISKSNTLVILHNKTDSDMLKHKMSQKEEGNVYRYAILSVFLPTNSCLVIINNKTIGYIKSTAHYGH